MYRHALVDRLPHRTSDGSPFFGASELEGAQALRFSVREEEHHPYGSRAPTAIETRECSLDSTGEVRGSAPVQVAECLDDPGAVGGQRQYEFGPAVELDDADSRIAASRQALHQLDRTLQAVVVGIAVSEAARGVHHEQEVELFDASEARRFTLNIDPCL